MFGVADHIEAVWAVSDGWGRLALAATAIAALGQVLFVVKYLTRSWYAYRVGRALMGKSASLAIVLVLAVIGSYYVLPEQMWAVAITAVAVFIWYQTYVLYTSPRYLNLDEEIHR